MDINRIHQQKLKEALQKQDAVHATKTLILQNQSLDLGKTIESLKTENANLLKEKKDAQGELYNAQNGFKILLDQSQSKNTKMEEIAAELKMQLQAFKEKAEKLEITVEDLQKKSQKDSLDKNEKIKSLEKQVHQKDDDLKEFKAKLDADKKATEAVQSLATQAGLGLAKKDVCCS